MERPSSFNEFLKNFGEDYDTEAEALKDWEQELMLYQNYVKGRKRE